MRGSFLDRINKIYMILRKILEKFSACLFMSFMFLLSKFSLPSNLVNLVNPV